MMKSRNQNADEWYDMTDKIKKIIAIARIQMNEGHDDKKLARLSFSIIAAAKVV